MEKDESSSMHVVVFPWLAFGHLLPFLSLSESLAARGHRVSFVSTPRNIQRLPPVAPDLAERVRLVPLPLPRVDGLPDGAEATSDVPYDKFGLHRKAFDGLAGPFSAFLDAAAWRPDWVFADTMHHWVAAAAAARDVPCALLLLCNASFLALVSGHSKYRRPRFEAERSKVARTEDASGISLFDRFMLTIQRCQLVAVRSSVEFEPRDLALLPALLKKPVVPLGLLPPSPTSRHILASEDAALFTWLDEQPARSVLYVALGSEAPVRTEQLRELAWGLELSGAYFLWALRKPNHGDDDSGSASCTASILPEGFETRTAGRGVVTMNWAPQMRILAHAAVGAFLTHCGWNSLVEGLQHGRPLVLLPILADQGANARLMEDRAVGVQVARDDDDGSFDGEGVAAAVRRVMVEEEGRVLEANAKKLQVIFADMARHESCIDDFVEHLMSYK